MSIFLKFFIGFCAVNLVATFPTDLETNSTGGTYPEISRKHKGINCLGSQFCDMWFAGKEQSHLEDLADVIHRIPDDRRYEDGQHIACHVWRDLEGPLGIWQKCAFFQKTKGRVLNGRLAKRKVDELVVEGCGSAPIEPSGDVYDGELTINYVAKTCPGLGFGDRGICLGP
ncbi:hypothetical protein DM02DRAFT_627646 [Periconia macrospinosa]|uniref:Killer toxin Kp4 domain-containing protein n=1 Tax=Periconia macrospinosa TaxID=97972 RepID=A0A2V1DW25_9PLEO|nr:hypothetical protein DM02DRAFT_627646 [Periconia macrospinosa]